MLVFKASHKVALQSEQAYAATPRAIVGNSGPQCNRPFPSSLVPFFQNESKCETFHVKMSSACSFIFMQIKVIFIRMDLPLDSL